MNKVCLSIDTEYGMKLVKDQLLTEKVICNAETDEPYNKGVVIERHHNTGHYHVSKLYGWIKVLLLQQFLTILIILLL